MQCPYLDTIQRHLLDFDMQKLCSVSLTPQNVYACLVCGKFFAGRGKHTHAYTHSVEAGHHVFINLSDGRVYCLPDAYEVTDASLDDIKYSLHPKFTPEAMGAMDRSTRLSTDVLGVTYLPGYIGINNLNRTDFVTVTVHALAHVAPLRNFFLEPANYAHVSSPLVHRFGQLIRRIWSPASFKATASPIEFIVEVTSASSKRFRAGQPTDVLEFLTWLLNQLHADLIAPPAGTPSSAVTGHISAAASSSSNSSSSNSSSSSSSAASSNGSGSSNSSAGAAAAGAKRARPADGSGKPSSQQQSIITAVFQGEIEVETLMSELALAQAAEKERKDLEKRKAEGEYFSDEESAPSSSDAAAAAAAKKAKGSNDISSSAKPAVKFPIKQRLPYLMLSLDLPPTPLFKDDEGGRVIQTIPLYNLLSKFDGVTETDGLRGQYRERKRYRIVRLPPYLLMAVKRFSRNKFFTEKNPSIVNFPVRNLELKPYVAPEAAGGTDPATGKSLPSADELPSLPASELLALIKRLGATSSTGAAPVLEKSEVVAQARAALASVVGTKYDLVANVVHDSPPESGTSDPLTSGSFRVHVHHEGGSSGGGGGQWYEVQDLHVQETLPQMIGLSETCLMVYKRQGYAAPVHFPPALRK